MNASCAHFYGLCATQRGFPCVYGAPIKSLSSYLRIPLSAKEAEDLKKARDAEFYDVMKEITIEDHDFSELDDITPKQIKLAQKRK
jgi:hypothetical protein